MEMGKDGDTAIFNHVIGFTCEGKCVLPLGLIFLGRKPG